MLVPSTYGGIPLTDSKLRISALSYSRSLSRVFHSLYRGLILVYVPYTCIDANEHVDSIRLARLSTQIYIVRIDH